MIKSIRCIFSKFQLLDSCTVDLVGLHVRLNLFRAGISRDMIQAIFRAIHCLAFGLWTSLGYSTGFLLFYTDGR